MKAQITQKISKGYKQTEIGVIPEDWELKSIEEMSIPNGLVRGPFGGALKKEFFVPKGYKVYEQRNAIYCDVTLGTYYINISKFEELRRFEVKKGDFIISCSGTIGKIYQIPENFRKGVINQALLKITINNNLFSDQYFNNYFKWEKFQQRIIDNTQGGAMKNLIGMVEFRKTLITLPPTKSEQTAIATVLSDTDALIEHLEKLVAKKKAIKQGAMQQLLNGKKRLPGFSGEWEVKTIKEVVQVPVSDGPHLTPKFIERGIPFLSVNNLVDNKITFKGMRFISVEDHKEFSKKCKPQKGDILLGKAASVGLVAVANLEIEFNIWSPIAVIRLQENHNPYFFYYSFQNKTIIDNMRFLTNSSSQGNLGMGDIEKINFLVPTKKEEEDAIIRILSDMDTEIEKLEQKLDKYRQIKTGMMQQLLTGKIRLGKD